MSGHPDQLVHRVLLVDDTRLNLTMLSRTLEGQGYDIVVARSGEEAISVARTTKPDLILLDIMLPDMDGYETFSRLQADPETCDGAVIFMSALDSTEDKVRGLDLGAVDYITKPFKAEEVIARVRTHMKVRHLEKGLRHINAELERMVAERSEQVLRGRAAVIFGLAKLTESRDDQTGQHLERICSYTGILGRQLARWDPDIDPNWVEMVSETAALHDVGKVGVPDAVLCKPGRLTDDERKIIQRHTTIGGDTLLAIKRKWEEDVFIVTATEIAFAHHERWDGGGYPFGLAREDIPLAARLVAVADVYDALTSRRVYKPAMPHEEARRIIEEGAGGHFDPRVVEAFIAVEDEFRNVAARMHNGEQNPTPRTLPTED